MIRAAGTILRKDLLLELRTKEAVPAMTLFTITVYVGSCCGMCPRSMRAHRTPGY